MQKRELNGRKIGAAISDATRTEILRHLIRMYPKPQTITDIEKILSKEVSPTTISFHLRKLRDAGLIASEGHKKGFRALRRSLSITVDNDGVHVKEVE